MKHSVLKLILAVTFIFCAGFAFAACTDGTDKKSYDYLVTFDYNVGDMEDSTIINPHLGVMENSLVALKPEDDRNGFKEPTLHGFYNEGWYTAKTDAEGNPVKDENGKVVLDRLWDFDSDRVNSDITLYANLLKSPKLTVVVDGGDDVVFDDKPGQVMQKPVATEPTKLGCTFAGYYTDSEFTTEFSWPYTFKTEDETIYAKFIEGDWTIVTTAEGFKSAIAARENIYLDSDIDFTDVKWNENRNFNKVLNGNNHKITGISCKWEGSRNSKNFGLFSTIGADAEIYDLTIEAANVNFNAAITDTYKVALFAQTINESAEIKNVTVSGTLTTCKSSQAMSATISAYAVCSNENDLGITSWENCNFGGITVVQN